MQNASTQQRGIAPFDKAQGLREHATARGWTVTGEYVDHASAAELRGRAAWRQVRNDDATFWDVLVVTKIDRGWRSVLAMLTDVERLDARGKSFQAATPVDGAGVPDLVPVVDLYERTNVEAKTGKLTSRPQPVPRLDFPGYVPDGKPPRLLDP